MLLLPFMPFWLTKDIIGMLFFQIEREACNGSKNDGDDDSNDNLVSLLAHPSYWFPTLCVYQYLYLHLSVSLHWVQLANKKSVMSMPYLTVIIYICIHIHTYVYTYTYICMSQTQTPDFKNMSQYGIYTIYTFIWNSKVTYPIGGGLWTKQLAFYLLSYTWLQ